MKRQKPQFPYPLVACSHHNGDPLPGYVVCVHAMADHNLFVKVERATAKDAGTVLCYPCAGHPNLPVSQIVTVCAHFVAEKFGVDL